MQLGPHNASAAAVDSNGNTFFAIPDDFSSTVWEYDAYSKPAGVLCVHATHGLRAIRQATSKT